MDNFLEYRYWNNTVPDWLIAAGIILISFLLIWILKRSVIGRVKIWAENTKTTWDNFLVTIIEKSVIPVLYVSSIYFAISTLSLPVKFNKVIYVVYSIFITFYVLRTISAAFKKLLQSFIQRQENGESKQKQADGLIIIVNIIIWMLGSIFLIDNLGYNVTTLIAGLGIGGIAIALAAQAILGDLFSYFVIFFDRPFEIGDFITLDDKAGVIEFIGIKTTRIRTLNGEQLICSNTDLTNSRVHNYKRLEKRRILFNLGVTYQTSHKTLSEIPGIVKEIVESDPLLVFDRGHFSGYGDFSLNFEFVYYVLDSNYNVYMDKQHSIYLSIYAAFERNKIEFAYPTQTLFVQKEATINEGNDGR